MRDGTRIEGKPVLLTRPEFDWEVQGFLVNEGPSVLIRHGKVFGAPMGEPRYQYYAEWEFADMDAFKSAARTDEFNATGKDAMQMGIPFHVHFASVE